MLKNPTTSVIVLIVVAVIITCVYILGSKQIKPVEEAVIVPEITTTVVPADGQPATTTEVTPISVTQ